MTLLSVFLQAAPAAPAADSSAQGGATNMIFTMLALGVVFYFFMIRPQQKKQKAVEAARQALKTGDKIITSGGIHGRIKEVNDTNFLIEISDNVRIKIEKSSVFVVADDVPKN